ncbi:MAG: FAD-binding protein [Leucobacter sp.]
MSAVCVGGVEVPVIDVDAVVVGTGSAGYCAADRLWEFGRKNIAIVADMVGAGASRNAGSDKQTYYKLTLSGDDDDSVRAMADTLYSGGSMDGDNALAEAALSTRGFIRLCDLGVPFPQNRYGEFIGYKTDHDPRRRATSVGPYTSRTMVEVLERKVRANGTPIFDRCRVVDVLTAPKEGGGLEVVGLLVLRNSQKLAEDQSPFLLFRTVTIVYATGGPAGIYERRVFPNGQWGASGAAYRAGVKGKNLTEWQFGLASIKPRWNVSGSYMQVIPRIVSTDQDGGDEREFLADDVPDYGRLLSLVFLKGYQWPFDVRKAGTGSSLIDLLVYRETVMRGRRVFMDFRSNPLGRDFDATALDPEAREYLERAGCVSGTPIERLRIMNEPAYQFYRGRNPSLDLEHDLLEIDVCAQHNNGGLVVDGWWESNVAGFYPVGEAGGAHGVYRPGGAALNSGQVGATRAAQAIAYGPERAPDPEAFAVAADRRVAEASELIRAATDRFDTGAADNTGVLLRRVQSVMSAGAGPVRSSASIDEALTELNQIYGSYADTIVADPSSRRSIDRVFLVRDIVTTAFVYLHAMRDYVDHGGRSRGSVLYTDAHGELPVRGCGDAPDAELELPDRFRFSLDGGALDGEVQEIGLIAEGAGTGRIETAWRMRRPIPVDDDFFENVWREFRERGPVW